jgi:hypothetical protein
MNMQHATRKTTALFAVLAAIGMAHAEGGPGDSGADNPGAAASAPASGHRLKHSKKGNASAAAKRAKGSSSAASGARAEGPMSNASVGKGG